MPSYYVSFSTGDDGNAGTQLSPWKNIDYAKTQLAAGDTLFAKAGDTWTGQQTLVTTLNSITLDTYSGAGYATVDWEGAIGGSYQNTIQLAGDDSRCEDWEVKNIAPSPNEAINPARAFSGGGRTHNNNNVTFERCRCENISGIGFLKETSSSVLDGRSPKEGAGFTLIDCESDKTDERYRVYGYRPWGSATTQPAVDDATYRRVNCYRAAGEGLSMIAGSDNGLIEDCVVWSYRAVGIYANYAKNTIARRNMVYGGTDSDYYRTTTPNRSWNSFGVRLQVAEPYLTPTARDSGDHDSTGVEFYLNIVANVYSGMCWANAPSIDSPPNGKFNNFKVEQNTVVNCYYSLNHSNGALESGATAYLRNNLLMSNGAFFGFHANTASNMANWVHDYNYAHSGWGLGPNSENLSSAYGGGNDPAGPTSFVAQNTDRVSSVGAIPADTDYEPLQDIPTIDLGYSDREGNSNLDNPGALNFGAASPPPPPATGSNDIRVERGVLDFSGTSTSDTFTTAAKNASSVFVRITSSHAMSTGPTAGTSSAKQCEDVGAWITSVSATGFSVARDSAAEAANYRVFWEAWFYDGENGGENEFIIRHQGVTSFVYGDSSNTETFATSTNPVAIVTGQGSTAGTTNNVDVQIYMASISGTTLTLQRNAPSPDTNAAGDVSTVVVDFNGSNWSSWQVTLSRTSPDWNTTKSATISDVTNWSQCLIFASHLPDDDEQAQLGAVVWPGATTTAIRHRADQDVNSPPTGAPSSTSTVFIVRNVDLSVEHFDTITGSDSELPTSGGNPSATTTTLSTSPAPSDMQYMGIGVIGHNGEYQASNLPRGFFGYRLTSTSQWEAWFSRRPAYTIAYAGWVADFTGLASGAAANQSDFPSPNVITASFVESGSPPVKFTVTTLDDDTAAVPSLNVDVSILAPTTDDGAAGTAPGGISVTGIATPHRIRLQLDAPDIVHRSPLGGETQRQVSPVMRWRATYQYRLDNDLRGQIMAVIGRLRGSATVAELSLFSEAPQRGSLQGAPAVNGVGQKGYSLTVDGIGGTYTNWMRAGDYFTVNGELKICTQDVNSSAGAATIEFVPRLRQSPPDDALLEVADPTGSWVLVSDSAISQRQPELTEITLDLVEALI